MTTQFFIVFKPNEAKVCEQTIYFDITGQCARTNRHTFRFGSNSPSHLLCASLCVSAGCESRLPLAVVGEAIGPQIQFNYNVVDMKNVFISDKGSYEVRLVTLFFIFGQR